MDREPGSSILIVDDEKSNLEVLSNILQPRYTVFVAKSGEVALKRAVSEKPDLILLDVVMPEMSGFEILSKLKESEDTNNIPVIFITGLDSVEDEEKGFFLGAVDYITKPFHASIVKARVDTQLRILKQMRTIERYGLLDALTGLPNRRNFDEHIKNVWARAVRENTPISLLLIDVDKFKVYNDTYGHPQGDVLLKTISDVFTSALKRTSDLIFRWGGEEFTAILPNTSLNGGLMVAENIRAKVEAAAIPTPDICHPTYVTVSIGVTSMIPTVDSSISDFFSQVDKALYAAKDTGRNRVCSYNEQGEAVNDN